MLLYICIALEIVLVRIFFPYNNKGILMYELKYKPSASGIQQGDFDFRQLQAMAVKRFVECPKFLTLVRHTDLTEVDSVHCYSWVTRKRTDFQVPKQKLLVRHSPNGLRFCLVRVINEEASPCWLVVCESNRQGFLLHDYMLNRFGNVVSTKRCGPLARRSLTVKRRRISRK